MIEQCTSKLKSTSHYSIFSNNEYEILNYWENMGWSAERIGKDYIKAIDNYVAQRYTQFVNNGEKPTPINWNVSEPSLIRGELNIKGIG